MNPSIVSGISGLYLCGKGLGKNHAWYNRTSIHGTRCLMWFNLMVSGVVCGGQEKRSS